MDTSITKFPVYAKLSLITVGLIGFIYILFVGQEIIIPLVFSTIIAILLNPTVNFLCNKKVNRVLAILDDHTYSLDDVLGSLLAVLDRGDELPRPLESLHLLFDGILAGRSRERHDHDHDRPDEIRTHHFPRFV